VHAVRLHAFGPVEHLRYETLADLIAGDGQVRIAVQAAGVHLLDTAIRRGDPGPFPLPALPANIGREVAGIVDAVGDGVEARWLGRRVVAHLGMASGGYADQAVAPASALHELPAGLAADVAVAMIGTGRTALAVLELAAPQAEDIVLVPAAAGGLGTLFVQALKHAGATVIGLAGGAEKVARVAANGADVALDYGRDDWPDAVTQALEGRRPTVVLDGVGGTVGRAALELLDVGGRHVIFGWASGAPTEIATGDITARSLTVTSAVGPRMLRRPGGLRDLETRALAEAAAGRLVPAVDAFPLRDAGAAHRALEQRATTGKVVLRPDAA
jgi:NADPH2:quinone reductase